MAENNAQSDKLAEALAPQFDKLAEALTDQSEALRTALTDQSEALRTALTDTLRTALADQSEALRSFVTVLVQKGEELRVSLVAQSIDTQASLNGLRKTLDRFMENSQNRDVRLERLFSSWPARPEAPPSRPEYEPRYRVGGMLGDRLSDEPFLREE